MKTDYIRIECALSDNVVTKLADIARSMVAGDRVIVELCDAETHIIYKTWRLRGNTFDPQKVCADAQELIRSDLATRAPEMYLFVIEWIGNVDEHWRHWLPPLDRDERKVAQRICARRAQLTTNQRTVLDCAARTLTDALIRADERALMRVRTFDDNRTIPENSNASFQVLFSEPVPLSMMPLLLAMAPLERAGKLPGKSHVFYGATTLGSLVEITSYGVGDALPWVVAEDCFGLSDDVFSLANDVPFDIANGKRPFTDIFNERVQWSS